MSALVQIAAVPVVSEGGSTEKFTGGRSRCQQYISEFLDLSLGVI
jgi:hypothetical protein